MDRYEEALERAKKGLPIDEVFPELKESEDERLRKELLEEIEFIIPHDDETDSEGLILPSYHARIDRYKSYLEKQKEQKPESCDCSRDEESYNNGIHHVLMNPEAYGLIKQKPTEWREDYREEDIQTRFAFYTYKDDPSVLYLSNVFVEETSRNHGFGTRILKAAEKVAEAIGAITICLKVKQDSPANAWYRKNGYGYVTFEDDYDWLEKNLEYMKPNKQEWSEEDELFRNNIIVYLSLRKDKNLPEDAKYPVLDAWIDWLKSLRPQPKQEWSEEDLQHKRR